MRYIYLIVVFFFPFCSHAQKFTINGSVKDQSTGENLIGASIFNIVTSQGTTANTYGYFSITLPRDSIDLNISYVGYQPRRIKFLLTRDTMLAVGLTGGTELQEVVIKGSLEDHIQESTRMGTIDVPIEQIKALPALLGEVDVFKVLQLLPGVQSGSEGS
ncbi:MAG TPA: carboxypeptidase-like regulatory domain-containing protein, partial [Chryseolinea sp.]|nr:carboxypeptidase-like regulatory domain-containing protein [Chryseolinea sp.]